VIQLDHYDLKEAALLHLIRLEAFLNQLFLNWITVEEISDFVLLKHGEVASRLSPLTQHAIW
jgi:hypothetical protein